MRASGAGLLLLVTLTGCGGLHERAYYPLDAPGSRAIAETLYRAVHAAGDDPARYSFALLASREVATYSADDATFYVSEGLLRQPPGVIEAFIARQVAHEVLGHDGQRRAITWSVSAGFTVLGFVIPGAGLLDFALNPLIVRAFTRDQVIAADLRAVEILRMMGHRAPQRTLAAALRAAHAVNGTPRGGWLATEPPLDDRLAALGPLDGEFLPSEPAARASAAGR